MIQTIKIYTIICDGCQRDFSQEDEYLTQYEDKELMEEIANDDGWVKDGPKHLCPACYEKSH